MTATKAVNGWVGGRRQDGVAEDVTGHVYPLSTLRRVDFAVTRTYREFEDSGWPPVEGRWTLEFEAGTVSFDISEAPSEMTRDPMASIAAAALKALEGRG